MAEQVIKHKKFFHGSLEAAEQRLRELKDREKNTIHYLFGCFDYAPQFVVLMYTTLDDKLLKEYIKVKPLGLSFHDKYHTSLKDLISWFKDKFHTSEYKK